jgi:hypothetical protein
MKTRDDMLEQNQVFAVNSKFWDFLVTRDGNPYY